jgi:hypothetical protein
MIDLLSNAITNRNRVCFIYHDKESIGVPQCCGISTKGKEVVRIHLIKGGQRPEQLFDVAQINSLQVLNEYFSKPGPNYKRNDSAMKEIFCQLE